MSLVNLLPEDYLAWRKQRRANKFCAVLFGVVIAAVVTAGVVSERNYGRTCEVRDSVNHAYVEAEKRIHKLQELEARRQVMLQKAVLTAGLQESVLRSYLLATATQALPTGSCIVQFELETKKRRTITSSTANTKFAKATADRSAKNDTTIDTEIMITGLAATDVEVAGFIAAMSRCDLVESVDLIYSQEKEIEKGVLVREFRVMARLRNDAQLVRTIASRDAGAAVVAQAGSVGSETR